jgi:two-component system chemotaxis response regulator CheB
VAKPKIGVADGLKQLAEEITDKIRIAAKAHIRLAVPVAGPAAGHARPVRGGARRPAVPLGGSRPRRSSSSAPPPAAPRPPRKCWCTCRRRPAVVITQHMPPGFTRATPRGWTAVPHPRQGSRDGERILPGHAYIAPAACT